MSARRFAVGDLVEFDFSEDALVPSDQGASFEHRTVRFRGVVVEVEEHEDVTERVRVSFSWSVPGGTGGQVTFLAKPGDLKKARTLQATLDELAAKPKRQRK